MAHSVTGPVRRPREGGIKSVIGDFIPETRLSVVNGTDGLAWEDTGCGIPTATRAGCFDDVMPQVDKTAEGPTRHTTIGDPFALYKGVECYIGGDALGQSYREQAEAVLLAGEDRVIEARLYSWAAFGTTETRPTIADAIARVEQFADNQYVGLPVILISRNDAVLAHDSGALTRENGVLITANKTPVIASGAITAGGVAAIGMPAVWASQVVTAGAIKREDNVEMAIAERLYAIGVDCDFRHHVTVDPTP